MNAEILAKHQKLRVRLAVLAKKLAVKKDGKGEIKGKERQELERERKQIVKELRELKKQTQERDKKSKKIAKRIKKTNTEKRLAQLR